MNPALSSHVAGLLLAAALCCVAAAAAAADAAPASTLAELETQLQQHNPQLLQARQAWLSAQLAVPQAGALPAPQFSLLEQANTGGPFDFRRDSGFYAYPSFTQPFLWFGKRGLAAEIAGAEADVAGRQFDALRLQLQAQLKLGYYQLQALQQQQRFMDEDLQRLEQIKETSRVRYANNAAAYVDYLNAQVAAGSLENDRYALLKQSQDAREQINNLLGRPSQQVLELAAAPDDGPQLPATPLDQLIELAQRSNPAIAGSQSQVQAADKSVALARKGFWPDFALSAGAYTDPRLVELRSSRMYSVGISIALPTWGFRKEQAALDQARAQLEGARAGEQASRQQVDLGVANAYHGLETALKQAQFTRERLLPQAQMAYRLALAGYSSGGGTAFSDLLQAQSGLRSTELSLIQAQNAALQAYVTLTAAIGKDPDSP